MAERSCSVLSRRAESNAPSVLPVRPLVSPLELMDPFEFVDDEIVEPQGIRDLPLAAPAVPAPVKIQTEQTVPSSTPANKLARSEQFFKEVAKADGSEVQQFVSDVMAWATSSNGVGITEAAPDAEAENDVRAQPHRRTYAEEKATTKAAAVAAATAKVVPLDDAAEMAADDAKAVARGKLSSIGHKSADEAPRGTVPIGGSLASHPQLTRRGTTSVPDASFTPAGDRKRNRVDPKLRKPVNGSAVKNRLGQSTSTTVRTPATSPPTSAVKTVPQKRIPISSPAVTKAKKRRPQHLMESSPVSAQPEVLSRPTRRRRNAIAPLPWWTAAGNAVASKRSLTAASVATAVSAARVM